MSAAVAAAESAPAPAPAISVDGKPASRLHPSSIPDAAQQSWAALPIAERLAVFRVARHRMAAEVERFTAAIPSALPRSTADTLTAELMPLLDACRFLEKNAARILRPRKLGRRGRPFWLRGITAEVHREPLGEVLVIGPANFPLFLPGVQTLQALAAGNRVLWKPAPGGRAVAILVAETLQAAGLPHGLLLILDESVGAALEAMAHGPDKVVFTGSHPTGCAILAELAKTATPAVMELSGADAVIVLPGANLKQAAKAVAFGLRLNGGQICMSPRRIFADAETMQRLSPMLERELESVPAVPLTAKTAVQLRELLDEATLEGVTVSGRVEPQTQRPVLLHDACPTMRITRSDVFAPVLSLLEVPSPSELPAMYAACEYGLTVSIFCSRAEEPQARALGLSLRAGTVILNDLIAPTADPRVAFGGRGASGYGVTRGEEGLLEMTAPKVLLVRRGGNMRHLVPTTDADTPLLANLIRAAHAGTWRERWRAVHQVVKLGKGRSAEHKETA